MQIEICRTYLERQEGDEEHKTFYLHLCYEDHQVALDQKLFQFIERNDPVVFNSYMHLKQALAILFPLNREEYRSVKSTYIEGVLSAYRLGEQKMAKSILSEIEAKEDGEQIKYWVYEFEMSEERKQEFDAVCALLELTPDEFFEAAVKDAIREAQTDPEEYKERCRKAQEESGDDIRLVRYYPVYKGETEAQAYKRTLAEEVSEKDAAGMDNRKD